MKTHICLELSDREDACMILVPIAGTTFLLQPDYQTVAILANGTRYAVDEGITEIKAALEVAIVQD